MPEQVQPLEDDNSLGLNLMERQGFNLAVRIFNTYGTLEMDVIRAKLRAKQAHPTIQEYAEHLSNTLSCEVVFSSNRTKQERLVALEDCKLACQRLNQSWFRMLEVTGVLDTVEQAYSEYKNGRL